MINKRGFTLIELLAVIVILAIILAIAVPNISNLIDSTRLSAFASNEALLKKAAKTYTELNDEYLPTSINDIKIVKLQDIQTEKFISTVTSPNDKNVVCDGYVTIKKIDNANFKYEPYLKCGNDYETDDYATQGLTSVEVLVVAGGGSGGSSSYANGGGGGGGAGGLIHNTSYSILPGTTYSVVVGNGGIGRTSTLQTGANGENSVFDNLIAIGGGGGGRAGGPGLVGGSGGGAGYDGYRYRTGPEGTENQGHKGGDVLGNNNGAGGGGAGGPGGNTTDTGGTAGGYAGVGGAGMTLSVTGSNVTYAKGGGGGGSGQSCGKAGTPNTGSGGNGIYALQCGTSGAGGSGIVVVRYLGHQKATGGTVISHNGYTIHTFTNVGTSTFNTLDF